MDASRTAIDVPMVERTFMSAQHRAPKPVAAAPPRCSNCSLREVCLPSEVRTGSAFDDASFTRKRVRRGEALYLAGENFRSLYAIRAGSFKSRMLLEDGRHQLAGFHMPGELLGMDGIGGDRYAADAIALEDSEVCIIPYARFEQPDLQRQLHRMMSRELVRDQGVMMLLGSMRAEERLAAFLLNLSQRFLARGYSPVEFHLRMTREEIGSYLGLTLETVSRLFSRFQNDGLIVVQQKHVCIKDLRALKSVLKREVF